MDSNLSEDKGILTVSFTEVLFFLFAGSLLFVKGMGFYEGQWPFDCMVVVAYISYTLLLVLRKHTIPELLVSIILTILGLVIYRTSGELGALFHLTFIAGMLGIGSKNVFKGAYYIWIITFVVQLFTSFIGVNPNNIYRIHEKMGQYIVRWSLGYTHPNVLHVSYIVLIMLIFYVGDYTGQKLVKASVIALLGSMAIFIWSVSYTGMLISVVYIVMNLIFDRIRLNSTFIKALIVLITPAAIIFSVLGPVIIKGRAFELIDKALSTRFTLSHYYLTTQPITWFGTKDFVLADTSIVLDCSYVYALMHYGIVFFLMMSIALSAVVIWLMRGNRKKELAIALGIVIAGITEPFLSNTSYKNIAFIFVAEYLFMILERLKSKDQFSIGKVAEKTLRVNCSSCLKIKNDIKSVIVKRKWTIIVIACLMIAIGALGYKAVVHYPDSIYSLLWKADRKPSVNGDPYSEYCYLDINNLPDGFNSWILSYTDEVTPLYSYRGFTLMFEYIRRALGVGIVCSFVTLMIYIGTKARKIDGST